MRQDGCLSGTTQTVMSQSESLYLRYSLAIHVLFHDTYELMSLGHIHISIYDEKSLLLIIEVKL